MAFNSRRVALNTVTLVVTLLIGGGLMEAAFRAMDGYALLSVKLERTSGAGVKPTEGATPTTGGAARTDARAFIETLATPGDVDPTWYELTPPLAEPNPPLEALDALAAPYAEDKELHKGVRRIWNVNLVRDLAPDRKRNRLFKRFPPEFHGFDPGGGDTAPSYRLFPNDPSPDGVAANTGMVTNNLGYRGIDVPVQRPANTIRIAFVGASTTMHNQAIPGPSAAEYAVFYLNRWAEASRRPVRFEAVNAGREGLQSHDLRAVVEYELAKLDPDIVVYYEGANQFYQGFRQLLSMGPTAFLYEPAKYEFENQELVLRATGAFAYSALLRRLALFDLESVKRFSEVPKPPYTLTFPDSVDEMAPDIRSPDLPLKLPDIVRDLSRIKDILDDRGGTLAVSSFVWLAKDGLEVEGPFARSIHWYLNGHAISWPLRYADIRRLVDFENRVFQRFADANGLPFLDVGNLFPQNPAFFWDGIHKTQEGIRLHGWIAFLELLPHVRDRMPRRAEAVAAEPFAYPFDYGTYKLCEVSPLYCETGD